MLAAVAEFSFRGSVGLDNMRVRLNRMKLATSVQLAAKQSKVGCGVGWPLPKKSILQTVDFTKGTDAK